MKILYVELRPTLVHDDDKESGHTVGVAQGAHLLLVEALLTF